METLTRVVRCRRVRALAALPALVLSACAGAAQPGASPSPPAPAATAAPARVREPLPVLKPTEPPADLDPTLRFAWQQVVHLGEAFTAGDAEAFLVRVSRGFYRGYGALETSLRRLLADSSDRRALVAVRKITEDQGRVSVSAEWTCTVTRRDGSVDAHHGQTEFLFLKSDTSLRLLDYRGAAPFAIAGI